MGGEHLLRVLLPAAVLLVLVCMPCCTCRGSEEFYNQKMEAFNGLCPLDIIEKREEAREMFYHAYDNYMMHAYPADELMPLSCKGRFRDPLDPRGHMDQVLGNYTLTLVDSLDTLAVLGDYVEFERGVGLIQRDVSFDTDVTVNLFEVTIRVLGGLLSSHLLAEKLQTECTAARESDWDPEQFGDLLDYREDLLEELGHFYGIQAHRSLPAFQIFTRLKEHKRVCVLYDYEGELLALAMDLGLRLLPAFQTRTGIPYSTINLKHGVGVAEAKPSTCLAGAGTLLVEFGTLSRLTGYRIFESAAARAMKALLNRKSASDLLPGLIDVNSGNWLENKASIGAGSDSFYEYLYKSYLLLGDTTFYGEFSSIYSAIQMKMEKDHHYFGVDYKTGRAQQKHIDSLQAFWPALQVVVGDVNSAVENHVRYLDIWRRVGFIPEVYFPVQQAIDKRNGEYPLRPEFIESTLFLFGATGRSFYRRVGMEVLDSLQASTRTSCGFASINVVKSKLGDRMDSYFLAETLKYLYILFDDMNWTNRGNYVFTTEGHPLPMLDVKDPNDLLSSASCPLVPETLHRRITDLERLFYAEVLDLSPGEIQSEDAGNPLPNAAAQEEPSTEETGVAFTASLITEYSRVLVYKAPASKENGQSGSECAFASEAEDQATLEETCASDQTKGARNCDMEGGHVFGRVELSDSRKTFEADDSNAREQVYLSHVASLAFFGVPPPPTATARRETFVLAEPEEACSRVLNSVRGKVAIVRRGGCNFLHKALNLQSAGATLMVVIDDDERQTSPFYMNMAGDGVHDHLVSISCVMLSLADGEELIKASLSGEYLIEVSLSDTPMVSIDVGLEELTAEQHADLLLQVSHALSELGMPQQRPSHGQLLAEIDLSGDVLKSDRIP